MVQALVFGNCNYGDECFRCCIQLLSYLFVFDNLGGSPEGHEEEPSSVLACLRPPCHRQSLLWNVSLRLSWCSWCSLPLQGHNLKRSLFCGYLCSVLFILISASWICMLYALQTLLASQSALYTLVIWKCIEVPRVFGASLDHFQRGTFVSEFCSSQEGCSSNCCLKITSQATNTCAACCNTACTAHAKPHKIGRMSSRQRSVISN